jgi:hypothetical protein
MFFRNLIIPALCILSILSAAPPLLEVGKAEEPVPGQYIVILKDGVDSEAHVAAMTRILGRDSLIIAQWNFTLNGFHAVLSGPDLQGLRSNPNVSSIDEDRLAHPQSIAFQ